MQSLIRFIVENEDWSQLPPKSIKSIKELISRALRYLEQHRYAEALPILLGVLPRIPTTGRFQAIRGVIIKLQRGFPEEEAERELPTRRTCREKVNFEEEDEVFTWKSEPRETNKPN